MPTIPARYRLSLFVCALALFALFAPATLAAPVDGTFIGKLRGREVAFRHNGKDRNEWAGLLSFKLASGVEVPVFCIQIDVQVRSGDPYRSDGSVVDLPNGCQIRYLLDTYPAASATTADEAAARQLAIWAFSDNLDLSTVTDAAVRDRAVALENEARGKPCPPHRSEAPTLAIDPPAGSAALGQPIAYALRASPAEAGAVVTVSVNGPAVFSDANGTGSSAQPQKFTLDSAGGARFWVLGTSAGQSTISAAFPYALGAGTVFAERDPNNPSQRLVLAQSQPFTAHAAARAAWAAQVPSPSPPTATATATAVPPTATPTRRPRPPATAQPSATPTEQTATPGGEQTATPTAGTQEQPPATPLGPTASPGGAAGGQGPPRPSSLPRTADDRGPPVAPFILGLLAIVVGGWMVRTQRQGK